MFYYNEDSNSKDPAAGTLRQDQVCPQKAYRELSADPGAGDLTKKRKVWSKSL